MTPSNAKDADTAALTAEASPEEDVQEEDWGLDLDFRLFAKHEAHKVYLNPRATTAGVGTISHQNNDDNYDNDNSPPYFWLECVEALTPLDMMNLQGGIHDATGNCVWTGAFLFLAALPQLAEFLHHKKVLELGSGTGIASLGLLVPQTKVQPQWVCMTDADPDALKLCQRNCQLNQLLEDDDDKNKNNNNRQSVCCPFEIVSHFWGEPWEPNKWQQSADTVIAADILYDIGMLPHILQSARSALGGKDVASEMDKDGPTKSDCHFVLSHVPRACYNTDHPPPSSAESNAQGSNDKHSPLNGTAASLEAHIVEQAQESGFALIRTLRPLELQSCCSINGLSRQDKRDFVQGFPSDALNHTSLQDMSDMGGSIFVFRLQPKGA